MPKTHPHAEANYRIFQDESGSFAVEVTIPDTYPTKVSPFATRDDAEDWIANHRRRVEAQPHLGRSWRRSGTQSERPAVTQAGQGDGRDAD
jgi:hypothetical protein